MASRADGLLRRCDAVEHPQMVQRQVFDHVRGQQIAARLLLVGEAQHTGHPPVQRLPLEAAAEIRKIPGQQQLSDRMVPPEVPLLRRQFTEKLGHLPVLIRRPLVGPLQGRPLRHPLVRIVDHQMRQRKPRLR